jgi:hypothetical protein
MRFGMRQIDRQHRRLPEMTRKIVIRARAVNAAL